MQPEKFLPRPLAPSADETALATIPRAQRRVAAANYILSTGAVFYWIPGSVKAEAAGSVVVPNEIATTSAYISVPSSVPGRWEADLAVAAVSALAASLGHIAKSTWTATKTGAYSAAVHELVKYDATGGAFSITLPSAVGLGADDSISLINVGTSSTAVTVGVAGGSQTIRGNGGVAATTYTLNQAGQTTVFIADGANWFAFPGT